MARSPGLLAADLTEKDRLKPLSGSLTVKLTGSGEAEMTLPEGGPAVNVHDLITIYTERGSAGVYRVTNVSQNYKKQIDISLLHAIDVLSDSVWADQTTFEGTRAQYITALLNQQTTLINGVKPWTLGTCSDTSTVKKDINYDRLSSLLEEMEEDGGEYYFSYDFSVFPWVVNYITRPSATASEFRLTRNVRSASVTYNDADLCTRLHLSVNTEKTEKDITSTVTTIRTYNNTNAQGTWGIVVKTADIDTGDDPDHNSFPEADAYAAAFLAKRSAPTVQIQIDGDDLSALTGDTWDEIKIGTICQVALPDYGHTFRERVISVSYPDLFKDPGRVTVSLANNLPKFTESLTDARKNADDAKKKAASVSRGAAKVKDLTTWSQTVTYQGQALDGTGVMTLWQSGIDMDAQGGVRIFSLQEGLQALYAGIEVTASQIRAEVSEGLSGMHSELLMTASQIKAEVNDSLSGIATFVIEADQIRAEVRDALSNLGALIVESSQIRAEVQDALSNIAQFEVTASQIRQEVSDNVNSLRASITLTASQIRQEVSDDNNSLRAYIDLTASQIRQEVSDENNSLRASITVTASQIRQEVTDQGNSLRASITTTACEIRADVEDNLNSVRSSISVTASQIRQEVNDEANSLRASITTTANEIRQEVTDENNSLRSLISVTASQIRQEVSDGENSLRSSITTNAGRIALVVNSSDNSIKGSVIVQAINGQSEAAITADKILLSGNTYLNGCFSISDGALYVSQDAIFRGNVSVLNGGSFATPSLQLFGGGVYVDLTASNTQDLITELQISQSGNVYTLQKRTVSSPETWIDVANFNRGSAAELSGAWSGATYTATAAGSTPITTTVGMAGDGERDSFTVTAFHDGVSTNRVNSINGFLVVTSSATKANNKAEVRLIARSGEASRLVSTVTLGDVYDAGASAVTLSGSWSGNTFTAKASSPNNKTTSTTVNVIGSGTNQPNFTVAAYQGNNTNNTVASNYVYLVENSGSKRVEARWASSTGTPIGQVDTTATYNAGKDSVTLSGSWAYNNTGVYTVTASNSATKSTTIHLTTKRLGDGNTSIDHFPVWVYDGSSTANNIIERTIYLTEVASSTRNDCRVQARWNSSSGTIYGRVGTEATYDAGFNAVTLSRTISGNHIQVKATNNAESNTYVNLAPSEPEETTTNYFNVSAYYGNNSDTNKLITRTVYIMETVSTNKSKCFVNARWNGASGSIYAKVSTENTFTAGANSVSLSKSWSTNGTFTVTPNNDKSPVTTTVGLTAAGQQDTATVYIYRDGNTSSTVRSENLFLVTTASTTKANNKVDLRWHARTGTGSVLLASALNVDGIYDAGYDAGYAVTTSDIQLGGRENKGPNWTPSGTQISGQNWGISKNTYGYYTFTISCHGTTKRYYFAYDTR